MNNLVVRQTQTPFSFLAIKSSQSIPNDCCSLAWCYDSFHLGGNNYFIYTCPVCPQIQIKKGTKPKEVLNWRGQNV